jgi:CHASE2 domain-containing sensor protein
MLFVLGEPRGRPDKDLPDYVKKNAVKLSGAAEAPPYPTLGVDAGVIEPLGKVVTAIGHLNVTPDVDGAIRTEPLVLAWFDQAYPSLSLLVAAKSHNLNVADIQVTAGDSVKLGKLKIGTDFDTRMLTFYYKDRDGASAFQVDSFFDVKSGKIPYDKYRDKIVLIGPTSSSVGSVFVTPINPGHAGGADAGARGIEPALGTFLRRADLGLLGREAGVPADRGLPDRPVAEDQGRHGRGVTVGFWWP